MYSCSCVGAVGCRKWRMPSRYCSRCRPCLSCPPPQVQLEMKARVSKALAHWTRKGMVACWRWWRDITLWRRDMRAIASSIGAKIVRRELNVRGRARVWGQKRAFLPVWAGSCVFVCVSAVLTVSCASLEW